MPSRFAVSGACWQLRTCYLLVSSVALFACTVLCVMLCREPACKKILCHAHGHAITMCQWHMLSSRQVVVFKRGGYSKKGSLCDSPLQPCHSKFTVTFKKLHFAQGENGVLGHTHKFPTSQ
jgi:hypothetical protein